MPSTRLHHSLPAPVVHAGFTVSQSKSHVLAGLQDAYWSDDEAEDAECPLCLEEMDVSDLNFKPCVCGYQICRFCWHHIKENLNKRCPACRRIYTDEAVEFKPIAAEDHKRLTQQKKQREREKKDLETLGRKHLANVRVVQRNVVYVVGIGSQFAKEELISTLRSNDYFGQYGKISKILLVKRNSPGGGGPVVGLYITYHRKEDAARCIAAVDGVTSPGGGRDNIMRASHGTTKYCMTFLRGSSCNDHNCMNLHEWGDEKDCFTKEDLSTLKHTIKATESRARTVTTRKGDEDTGLPRAASWGQKGISSTATSGSLPLSVASRSARRPVVPRQSKSAMQSLSSTESRSTQPKSTLERKLASSSLSRPSTPATVTESARADADTSKTTKPKEVPPIRKIGSPAPSATHSNIDSPKPETAIVQEVVPQPTPAKQPDTSVMGPPPGLTAPPGLSAPPGLPPPPGLAAPPGLSAPPGLPPLNQPSRAQTESPQTPLLASQSSYQMSNAARALLEDVKARREAPVAIVQSSPFPDFDRTLQTLSGEDGGGFSFTFDPKLADEVDATEQLPEFDVSSIPFNGSFPDAFPALRTDSPFLHSPSLSHAYSPNYPIYEPSALQRSPAIQHEKPSTRAPNYIGSFNPFSEPAIESVASTSSTPSQKPCSPIDEERKVSRFGFARGRQSSTAASSPLHSVSPLGYASEHQAFYHTSEELPTSSTESWMQSDSHLPGPQTTSPLTQFAQAQSSFSQPQGRLSSLSGDLSEAQLRNFILSSQERVSINNRPVPGSQQQFMVPQQQQQEYEDPAIMSASFPVSMSHHNFQPMAYGPPPGLPTPQRPTPPPMMQTQGNLLVDGRLTSGHVPQPTSTTPTTQLTAEDFPALTAHVLETPTISDQPDVSASSRAVSPSMTKAQEKAERKAAKKAILAQKALEKTKLAEERADAKAAEKAKIAKKKAAEIERKMAEPLISSLPPSLVAPKPPSIETPLPTTPGASFQAAAIIPAEPFAKSISKKSAKGSTSISTKRSEPTAPSKLPKPINNLKDTLQPTIVQVPLLSKKPKKNKPVLKPAKVIKEEEVHEESAIPSITDSVKVPRSLVSSAVNSRSQSPDRLEGPTSVQALLQQIDAMYPGMDLATHPFFDPQKLASPVRMPLEYGPLVHALSALSVGGGSFANNIPSGSIDNAVSSFQQLLETLTQTISDLLRLLPRTTWDDSSSFDGVLRDMLKGDDFLDDGTEEGTGKEDEVVALTLALERRARWMEVQLSKLEELHRDINTAAVKAVFSFNDYGWDRNNFLPRNGNSLNRFSNIGTTEENGIRRPMTTDELEKKLTVAKEAAVFAETEIREAIEKYQVFRN
ncbi:hypothetical protein CPB83DRAFT_847618 [Crepidotus variabilis]|uniref:RING-type domain-containing protein n=1 Tax=Crepidotus variabilis TaxID=179855 RepID=A0A9P6EP28_9AGAR|nr:hypothetical protein CPB83DRAFT_847618 [Crepidotus variabilis]